MSVVSRIMQQFYRRPLPEVCTAFTSDQGRRYFREALDAGTLEVYFPLSEQFRTQDEPAYCGLSTLVMALNTLSIDPGRTWKGPWRWYHESMLDCCEPLDIVQKQGITLSKFMCLARCNGCKTTGAFAEESTQDAFRDMVVQTSKQNKKILVASYSRKGLNQTGDGHFSPVGGYHEGSDSVLIMDVARFKYPPHWVSVSTLWNAMNLPDPATGRSRGYVLLEARQPSVSVFRLFAPTSDMPMMKDAFLHYSGAIRAWMLAVPSDAAVSQIVASFVSAAEPYARHLVGPWRTCCALLNTQQEVSTMVSEMLEDLRGSKVFGLVTSSLGDPERSTSPSCVDCGCSNPSATVSLAHILSVMVLAMPAEAWAAVPKTAGLESLRALCVDDTSRFGAALQEELASVKAQVAGMEAWVCDKVGESCAPFSPLSGIALTPSSTDMSPIIAAGAAAAVADAHEHHGCHGHCEHK